MLSLKECTYKNIKGVKAENDILAAVILPDHGGKIASLFCKPMGREFLEQVEGEAYRELQYAGDYGAAECSGFDDLMPTIDPCSYTDYPWTGVDIPDHGEVCAMHWNYEVTNGVLHLWVYSPRFGYKLEKWISNDQNALKIDYLATNLTQFDFDYVYAAHCMIASEAGAQIILPGISEGAKSTVIFASDPARGVSGDTLVWETEHDGLDITPNDTTHENFKIYFNDPVTPGLCKYRYPNRDTIVMEYTAETLPYFGIWFNRHFYNGLHNIAFEPCTGSFDTPAAAKAKKQNSVLRAYESQRWTIRFSAER
jgi:hypothetical protein